MAPSESMAGLAPCEDDVMFRVGLLKTINEAVGDFKLSLLHENKKIKLKNKLRNSIVFFISVLKRKDRLCYCIDIAK